MADQQLANKAAAPAQPINLLLDIVNGRHKLSRAIPIALLIFDALLCILIILKVPYTEIDWAALDLWSTRPHMSTPTRDFTT
ncbi:hypothetical protein HYQ45_007287 [Verticillium longisporum]|uniref:Dol-P-Man:Man(5)GlcNAc(2)-PP-Dol alpha-1,3-mannosyltransferase n=1 Tax=Verticillium longisporum TaxID=100787 RepID=A0A8I2ZNK8_VERLO|nr:hypothetical protein HYQ45_007287 [Verticillium longisporum]